MTRRCNPVTIAMRQAKTEETLRRADEYAKAQARPRTEAAKAGLLDTLDALRVEIDNLAGAIQVGHEFDIRAAGDAMRSALTYIRSAEQRIVQESGLEVAFAET